MSDMPLSNRDVQQERSFELELACLSRPDKLNRLFLQEPIKHIGHYFLNRFANACFASFGAPEEVSRSTTVRGANSSQVLRAFLLTMRLGIDLPHSKCAPGSK